MKSTTLTRLAACCTLLLSLAFVGCKSAGPLGRVGYDWDQSYDLNAYKSFSIAPINTTSAISPILLKRVGNEVTQQLTEKGLTLVRAEAADSAELWVVIHATSEIKVDSYNYGSFSYGASYTHRRMGVYGGYGYPIGGTEVRSYEEGTLMLDLVDSKAKELVWRGYGSAEMRGKDISDEEITASVTQLMQNFPPPVESAK